MSKNSSGPPNSQEKAGGYWIALEFMRAILSEDQLKHVFLAGSVPGKPEVVSLGLYTIEKYRDLPHDQRHHFSAGLYPLGSLHRKDAEALGFFCLVIDDVGAMGPNGTTLLSNPSAKVDEALWSKGLFPWPTWVVETSKGNYQYGFLFKEPLSFADIKDLIFHLKTKVPAIAAGIHSAGQYFRLPSGTNTKPDRGSFETKLDLKRSKWVEYTRDSLLEGFGFRNVPRGSPGFGVSVSPAAAKAPETFETCSPETLRAVLELIPNVPDKPKQGYDYFGRETWVGVAHAIARIVGTGEEGRSIWLWWNNDKAGQRVQGKPDEPARVWDSLPPDHRTDAATLRVHVENIFGADSDEYDTASRLIAQDQAKEAFAFSPVEDSPGEDPGTILGIVPPSKPGKSPETLGDRTKFDQLLLEASSLVNIPSAHQGATSEKWLDPFDGSFEDEFAEIEANPVPAAPPTIFPPHVRGLVSMVTGPPGKGKSTLLLGQAVSVALGRGDLLRDGQTPLQFPGDVIYVSNEDSRSAVRRRIMGFMARHGTTTKNSPHRFVVVRSNLLVRQDNKTVIDCLDILEAIVKHLKSGRPIAMIVVDTLPSSIVGVEENSVKEMMEVLNLLKRIAAALWAAVVFVHHGTKETWDTADRSNAGAARGTGALFGTVRGCVALTDPTPEERRDFGLPKTAKIVAEVVLKDSDGEQGVTPVCFYELVRENVSVSHAVTGAVVSGTVPVMVPLKVINLLHDDAKMAGWYRALWDAATTGGQKIYRLDMNARSGAGVHDIFKTDIKQAFEIVAILINKGWVTLEDEWVKGHPKSRIHPISPPDQS